MSSNLVSLEKLIKLKRTDKNISVNTSTSQSARSKTLAYGEPLFVDDIGSDTNLKQPCLVIGPEYTESDGPITIGTLMDNRRYLTPIADGGLVKKDLVFDTGNEKLGVNSTSGGTTTTSYYYLGKTAPAGSYEILTTKKTVTSAQGGTGLSPSASDANKTVVVGSDGNFEFRPVLSSISISGEDIPDSDKSSLVTAGALNDFVGDRSKAYIDSREPFEVSHGGTGLGEIGDGSLLVGTGTDALATIDLVDESSSFNGVLMYDASNDENYKHNNYSINNIWDESDGLIASTKYGETGAINKGITFRSSTTHEGSIVLTSGVNYGDNLPLSGVEGQIFYKRYVW